MALPGHRVLLIGTMRPGRFDDWEAGLTRLDHVSRLPLGRLGPKHLVRLLSDAFQSENLAHDLAGRIGAKSDGNPFFVFEIIRGLREGQFLTQRPDGTWATTKVIEEIEIPSSVLDLVNARVADLDDEERNLLDVAACWGFEFDASLVSEALGMARLPVLQRFAKLEKRDRLVRASGRHFVFDHHQVQEALYEALPEMLREAYHAALAEALEARESARDREPADLDGALCVALCDHFIRGGRGERAARYFACAQGHLVDGYLNAPAVALSERALAVPDLLVGGDRLRALMRLAMAYEVLGDLAARERATLEALEVAEAIDDDRERMRAVLALAGVRWRQRRLEEAEACYREVLERACADEDRWFEARARGGLALVLTDRGAAEEALGEIERQIELLVEGDETTALAPAYMNKGSRLLTLRRMGDARAAFEHAGSLARECGDRQLEAPASSGASPTFATRRDGPARHAPSMSRHSRGCARSETGWPRRSSQATSVASATPRGSSSRRARTIAATSS